MLQSVEVMYEAGGALPFAQWNLMEGPSGALANQTYRSFRFLASKKRTLLQPCIAISVGCYPKVTVQSAAAAP